MPVGQRADELGDPVAQLEREVRRRGAHELAHVVDGDLAAGAIGMLGLAHEDGLDSVCSVTGLISRRASIRACVATGSAASSPIIQP
jgi:hypothetical protein